MIAKHGVDILSLQQFIIKKLVLSFFSRRMHLESKKKYLHVVKLKSYAEIDMLFDLKEKLVEKFFPRSREPFLSCISFNGS